MVSLKRRREIAQEAKEFVDAYRLARAYAKAGDTEMANFCLAQSGKAITPTLFLPRSLAISLSGTPMTRALKRKPA
jgi:hypothetical protein